MPSSNKLEDKSCAELKAIAWKHFSIYIRRKYADEEGYVKCFTCRAIRHWKEDLHAGHYLNAGTCGDVLYVHEKNVHPQCGWSCNKIKSGNKTVYERKLVEVYGEGIIEELHHIRSVSVKYTKEQWILMIMHYRNLNKTFTN